MLTFETVNELTLKVTSTGNDTIFTKAGAFIAGDCGGNTNYRFEKVLLGPQKSLAQAALGSLMRRVTGENIPLMKVTMNGPSETFYAVNAQHVVIYKLEPGETISVESENLLAFTQDCKYSVRFIGVGVLSQKGFATTTLTGTGSEAYVAILTDGNPIALSNVQTHNTISVDPDAVICWMGEGSCDPRITTDVNWKTFIGQADSYGRYKARAFSGLSHFQGTATSIGVLRVAGTLHLLGGSHRRRSRCGFHPRLLHLRFRGRTRAASPRRSCRWRSHRHEAAQGLAQQEE